MNILGFTIIRASKLDWLYSKLAQLAAQRARENKHD